MGCQIALEWLRRRFMAVRRGYHINVTVSSQWVKKILWTVPDWIVMKTV